MGASRCRTPRRCYTRMRLALPSHPLHRRLLRVAGLPRALHSGEASIHLRSSIALLHKHQIGSAC
uniref:Uncharacterized protein n=1 Tax=Arundo donax TaxID=35708 RepID=A0A0A8ZF48_ARUDO